ncbi:RNA/RNP complex-1-interacting phosphatase isoform X2 [Nelusetta ayraudi]|uniref:RNA/RNP complex-1-interacting phosphatase isoform X2 n=1 Tax=Nelusetta ayraudi TaxID=303726 RepID=UPI003F6F06BF
MSRHNKHNGIPDRWLDYKAVGKRLEGTRFIAFKVPLKKSLHCKLRPPDIFGHWELLDALNKENQELGLIIDLTFTSRYYNIQDVPESLVFLKIYTKGHEVPSDETILSFKRAVHRFLRDNAGNDKLIGVHCTHGLNRTGYLICRYLIDVDGMDPKKAVELFNSSRGHTIERKNYLDDLQQGRKRSNVGMDNIEVEPVRGFATDRQSETWSQTHSLHADSRSHRSSRSSPPRRTHSSSHYHHPNPGFPPRPPLFPTPPPPPQHPYRWNGPPAADSNWRRPQRQEDIRPRYPRSESHWTPSSRWEEDRRRSSEAPPPLPPPLPRYSPRWGSQSIGHDAAADMWDRPKRRHGQGHSDYRYGSRDNF